MATTWNCLYWLSDDAGGIVERLQHWLTIRGYTLFNPFGVIPGKAYKSSVRLFVAPVDNGWVRIIGGLDGIDLTLLSKDTLLIYAALHDTEADLRVYQNGELASTDSALMPYLRPNVTLSDLQRALHTTSHLIQSDIPQSGLPFDALPDNVKVMASKVNTGEAQKMFARLSNDLMKRFQGDAQAEAARALINGENAPIWSSNGGERIQAVMNCLNLSSNWREPDFDNLRDSYQLHERHHRSPNARLYPGDDVVMAKVPDALLYTPVYGGMS